MLMVTSCFNTAYAASIVVFGDSISAAYGIEVNKGWVAKLQQKLKQQKKIIKSLTRVSVAKQLRVV